VIVEEDQKRRAIRKYFAYQGPNLGWILVIVGAILCLLGFAFSILFLLAIALIISGFFLVSRHRTLGSDSRIDEWIAEDLHRVDAVNRARNLLRIEEEDRKGGPILLIGAFEAQSGQLVIKGERMGDDGGIRLTPIGITVILCSYDQLGIYQAGLDLTTGNLVGESSQEVFYQDVIAIRFASVTTTDDTKSALENVRLTKLSRTELARGISQAKLLQNFKKVIERYQPYIVADLLQREMSKVYYIDFADGRSVVIPLFDGRPTRQANLDVPAASNQETVRAMVSLGAYVREKKRALLKLEQTGQGALL
jgi:hypothetical protein